VPPEPIPGIFEPAPPEAAALARDHDKALGIEPALRRVATGSIMTLAPSEPFDAATIRAGGPMLERIMHRLLWLYADYWRAARRVLVEGIGPELPTLGLAPLRTACDPAVALFVFTDEDGGIGSAGYVSLLTGRVLAQVSLGHVNQGATPKRARSR
jgi:hypothetical protein